MAKERFQNHVHAMEVDKQSNKLMPKTANNLSGSNIALPVTMVGTEREFLFTTTVSLALNAVFTSSVYDGTMIQRLTGIVSANQTGTLYIQESDDQVEWYTTFAPLAVAIAGTDVINAVTYNKATPFEHKLSARYFRILYVNGATAQTRFALSAYSSN